MAVVVQPVDTAVHVRHEHHASLTYALLSLGRSMICCGPSHGDAGPKSVTPHGKGESGI
jgi:hypothetical protein